MISNRIGLIRSDLFSWLDGVGGFIVRKFDSNSVFLRNETDFATEDLIEISTVFFIYFLIFELDHFSNVIVRFFQEMKKKRRNLLVCNLLLQKISDRISLVGWS